jgi:Flp pilus assembly protein TadB
LFQHVPLLVATGVSMLIGVVWIRQITNIEV